MRYLIDFQRMAIHIVSNGVIVKTFPAKNPQEFAKMIQALDSDALDKAGFSDRANATMRMQEKVHDGVRIYSKWDLKHIRDGKVIHEEKRIRNLYVTEGINNILTSIFKGGTPIDPWYVGIQRTDSPAAGWTMANQGTTWEQFTDVDEATWPEAVDGAIAAGEIDMSQVTFNINAPGTVYGAHLTSNSVKDATTGTLLCAVSFTASRAVQDGDDLLVTYTVGCQDDGE